MTRQITILTIPKITLTIFTIPNIRWCFGIVMRDIAC
jgi:hypothetical protein